MRSGRVSFEKANSSIPVMMRLTVGGLRIRNERKVKNAIVPLNLGVPINLQTAIALRKIVFGQCPTMIRPEYFSQGPGMVFRPAERDLGYALLIGPTLTTPSLRSILMAVQTHILKALLFNVTSSKLLKSGNPLAPTVVMQNEALCLALADIIWKAGSGLSCIICLLQTRQTHIDESDEFNADGVTERLQLVELNQPSDLYQLLRRYLHVFQEAPGPGLLLLIYSAVLTRGIERVNADLETHISKCLLSTSGRITFSMLNLLLNGSATPYLHNGLQYRREKGVAIPENGVLIRSPIGLLVWMENQYQTASFRLGSRLRTPVFPIWLIIVNDQSGILFSANRSLLNDYQMENRFRLRYITSSHQQKYATDLFINNYTIDDPSETPSLLEEVIRTKWTESFVNWNGIEPFV